MFYLVLPSFVLSNGLDPQKKVEVTVLLGFTEFLGNQHDKVLDYWVLSFKKQKDCVLPGFTEFCFVQWA